MEEYGSYGRQIRPSSDGTPVPVRFGLSLQNILSVETAGTGRVDVTIMTWAYFVSS